MAAELVEAKVSERQRCRSGRAEEGTGAERRAEVCAFRLGSHGAARLQLGTQPPLSPPAPGLRVWEGGGETGGGAPKPHPSLCARDRPRLEAGFFPLQFERLGSGSL